MFRIILIWVGGLVAACVSASNVYHIGDVDRDGNLTAAGKIRKAQREIEFALPNVVCVRTAPLYDMEADAIYSGPGGWQADVEKWRQYGDDRPYHYLGSPLFFARAGTAFAEAMNKLLDAEARLK